MIPVALDQESTALEPLYESVDPELDALPRSNGSSATPDDLSVTFTVAGRQAALAAGWSSAQTRPDGC